MSVKLLAFPNEQKIANFLRNHVPTNGSTGQPCIQKALDEKFGFTDSAAAISRYFGNKMLDNSHFQANIRAALYGDLKNKEDFENCLRLSKSLKNAAAGMTYNFDGLKCDFEQLASESESLALAEKVYGKALLDLLEGATYTFVNGDYIKNPVVLK